MNEPALFSACTSNVFSQRWVLNAVEVLNGGVSKQLASKTAYVFFFPSMCLFSFGFVCFNINLFYLMWREVRLRAF